jgi:hypothetical protein
VFNDGYVLWIDGKQVSKDYGGFAIPFIGGASLRGKQVKTMCEHL